jgi:type I pantothenate kinase
VLQQLLAHWPEHPNVALVTTDGFLLPNAELERRGILHRKGFPESYDRGAAAVRHRHQVRRDEVEAPVYSHLVYDVVPDEKVVVQSPDIVIVEGLNVLQPARFARRRPHRPGGQRLLRLLVYVDAAPPTSALVRRAVPALRETAFRDPASYFHRYADLSRRGGREAERIWDTINGPT